MRIINLTLKSEKGHTKRERERERERKLKAIRVLTIHQNCSYQPPL